MKPRSRVVQLMSETGMGAAEASKSLKPRLQPKPRWMPDAIWRRILARLLYLEHS